MTGLQLLSCKAKRHDGAIAQLVEQRTENPCVPGSIPGGTTWNDRELQQCNSFFLSVWQASFHAMLCVGSCKALRWHMQCFAWTVAMLCVEMVKTEIVIPILNMRKGKTYHTGHCSLLEISIEPWRIQWVCDIKGCKKPLPLDSSRLILHPSLSFILPFSLYSISGSWNSFVPLLPLISMQHPEGRQADMAALTSSTSLNFL